ncbi:MAG: GDP-mannose 4,6-dehydratase [Ruminococcus flavefaciens]|nr:GDP-mannose 4,6-dehydratase [Ruminococcus flavefaciens]
MMKKIIITGFSGFVASHFMDYLYKNHPDFEVYGVSLGKPVFDYEKYKAKLKVVFYEMNLMDGERLCRLFREIKPDYVLHLAAFSSVAYSWQHPEESFTNNCNIFINLIDAIKRTSANCRILSVGSSEEYGNVAHEDIPIRENQRLNPSSPYAVARVSQEQLSKVYVDAYDMQIIMTRSFNHIGPRQDERFVIPGFVKRILDIKRAGLSEGEIETGDLSIIRDFVDVRDVVEAYYMLMMNGTVGEVYNICSGRGVKLSDIVNMIANEVGVKINTKINPEFVRPSDNCEIVGTPYKIETELGWKRKWKLRETIKDMIAYQNN